MKLTTLAFSFLSVSLVALGACKTYAPIMAAEPYPEDYRLRHPIAVTEADRSIVVFIGQGRGGMTAGQRAHVMGMAQTWLREMLQIRLREWLTHDLLDRWLAPKQLAQFSKLLLPLVVPANMNMNAATMRNMLRKYGFQDFHC